MRMRKKKELIKENKQWLDFSDFLKKRWGNETEERIIKHMELFQKGKL